MKPYTLKEDITILYITAKSFPDGIKEAFEMLENKIPDSDKRTFFGLSKPNEKGVIVYRAGVVQQKADEATQYGLDSYILTKGEYASKTIKDWDKKPWSIGEAFQQLLDNPDLDPASFCVEQYQGADVVCMVKLLKK